MSALRIDGRPFIAANCGSCWDGYRHEGLPDDDYFPCGERKDRD